MIVRAVVEDPSLIDRFDYFNDTDDTVRWLMGTGHEDLARKLREADRKYWKERFKK